MDWSYTPYHFCNLSLYLDTSYFGDTLAATLIDFQGASYVYPFMDPSTYQTGITGLLLFDLGILTPFVIVLSILVIYLKSSFELRITK
ncbi:MAG: hypothetical protein V1920_01225 [Bacillota bacterium]